MTGGGVRRVVVLVHGTWARGATWIEPDSQLSRALASRFGNSLCVVPFRWSGGNNPAARARAEHELRQLSSKLLQQHPDAEQFIVAHSHGGNVAFYALRDESVRKSVTGVVCLATPFLVARRRVLGGRRTTAHIAGAVGILLPLMYVAATSLLSALGLEAAWFRELGAFVFLLVGMVLIVVVLRAWFNYAGRLEQMLELAPLGQEGVLIIRAPGDEASAALLFFQFVSQLTVRLYLLLHQTYTRLQQSLERWSAHPFRLSAALLAGFALMAAALFAVVLLELTSSPVVALVLLLSWLSVAVPAFTLIGWIEVAAFPLQFLVGALLFATILILSAALLPFGAQVALSNILLDVTAEPTPPGVWTLHQIGNTASPTKTGAPQPLQHSIVYDDAACIDLICSFIERRGAASQPSVVEV